MVKDPKFIKDAERLNPGAPHFYGEELVRGYPAGVSGSPDTLKYMRNFLTEKYDIRFD
jgi:hypothetical protein